MDYATRKDLARDWVAQLITRYDRPAHLTHDKATAELADMAEDLNSMIPDSLNTDQYHDTLRKAARVVRTKHRSRSWPTIAIVCQAVRESLPRDTTTPKAVETRSPNYTLDVTIQRIKNRKPVSDSYLWGALAHELLAHPAITPADLEPYRQAVRDNLADLYSPDEAKRMIEDLEQRHRDANPNSKPNDPDLENIEW